MDIEGCHDVGGLDNRRIEDAATNEEICVAHD